MRPSSTFCLSRRLPRAGIDPIDRHDLALRTVMMAAHLPPRPETIMVFLDDARRGDTIVVVEGTSAPDRVIDVVELFTQPSTHQGRISGVIVGSVRTDPTDAATAGGDVDRWLEISDIAEGHGVEVVEWFVIDPGGVVCPRDALGAPPRW